MSGWLNDFILTFVPLFIVIDAVGDLSFVIKASEGRSIREQHRIAHVAVLTAAGVGLLFLFFGQLVLKLMNIKVGAFAIAGGIILLILAVKDLVTGRSVEIETEAVAAVAPIGTPLLAGPATITALLLLTSQYPLYIVLISYILNLAITWGFFMGKDKIVRIMGIGGIRAVSNVFNLLLAAIAVAYAIRGLQLLGVVK
jgi:multiple antibiotic resistance protein